MDRIGSDNINHFCIVGYNRIKSDIPNIGRPIDLINCLQLLAISYDYKQGISPIGFPELNWWFFFDFERKSVKSRMNCEQ